MFRWCILIKISPGAVVHVRNLGRHTCSKTICYMFCKVLWRYLYGWFSRRRKSRNKYRFIWKKFYVNPDEVILSFDFINMLRKTFLSNSKTYKIKSFWFISDARTKIIFPDFHARISTLQVKRGNREKTATLFRLILFL